MDLEALKRSVIIILKEDGSVAGTGFVLSDKMAVTCAHVIEIAKASIGLSVNVYFYASGTKSSAKVMPKGWSSSKEDDTAFLQLSDLPDNVNPVLMRTAIESAQHTYVVFGFARITTYEERIAEDKIGGIVKAGHKNSMLQLTGYEVAQGLSGAPVLDKESGYVVGMMSEYADEPIDVTDKKKTITIPIPGARFAWATTADTLKALMPALEVTSTLADWQRWSDERRSALIRETREKVGVSPLMEYWQSFLANEPWIDLVKNAISRAIHVASRADGFEDLISQLKSINTSMAYPQVRREIRRFTYQTHRNAIKIRIDEVHRQIKEIDSQRRSDYPSGMNELVSLRNSLYELLDVLANMARIAEQSYKHLFLVLGRLGSGRTHFINQVVEQTLNAERPAVKYLCILLDRTRAVPHLEACILQALSQATRQQWPDIRSWHRWMQTNYAQTKVILIIDDIQYWMATRANFLEDLASMIIETTHYRAFLWIITADTASYPRLQSQIDIWNDYGFSASSTPKINQWIVLENINELNRVGEQIICSNWLDKIDSGILGVDFLTSRNKSVYLQMPFVAWIFLDIQASSSGNGYFGWNINFIQFVEYFWEIRWKYLLKLMSESKFLQLNKEIVRDIIIYCADMGSLSSDYIFGYKKVLELAVAKNAYSADHVRYGLDLLAHGDLIDIQTEELDRTSAASLRQTKDSRVRLYFEPFWDFHIAARIIEHLHTNIEQNEVQNKLSAMRLSQQINPGVLTFLLLLADNDSVESLNGMGHRLPHVLSEFAFEKGGSMEAAVYQAAVRASPELQSFIIRKIEQRASNEGDSASDALFEQLSFVSEALRSELPMGSRLKLLRMRYPSVAQAKFGDYVCYLVHTWLQRAQSSDEIVLALPDFEGCEVLGVTESLAKLTAEGLLRTIRLERPHTGSLRSDHAVLIDIFLQYALQYGSTEKYRRVHHQASEERTYFYEWFLYWVCQLLVSDLGWQAYEMFKLHDWYDNTSRRFAGGFALRMRREANWAQGYWYNQQALRYERQHFEDLVRHLADSVNTRDRETAFFLIRHTQPTGKRKAVRVREVFHAVLRKLFLDPELDQIVLQYYQLFEVNFTEEVFLKLEDQRQSRKNRSGGNRRPRN